MPTPRKVRKSDAAPIHRAHRPNQNLHPNDLPPHLPHQAQQALLHLMLAYTIAFSIVCFSLVLFQRRRVLPTPWLASCSLSTTRPPQPHPRVLRNVQIPPRDKPALQDRQSHLLHLERAKHTQRFSNLPLARK
ncbi:hypothetical protein P171DRAFT_157478 [Karstenula rhodostoma CBS 690.94]|uniref:Uncharacterized protein n=1 Tax=Karstenula rhodostoma CBS 690.94 TaxID=1392251 RepID=A0A9P4U761_9PLEO|nr:hypothetical protein P171DRAFT_157478 [Karstenula rhodostoma CBS 690.94]